MKLIDTHQAGDILGVTKARVRSLIKLGLLKDYNPVDPAHRRHHNKVSITEVRELKKNYTFKRRAVLPNGNSSTIQHIERVVVPVVQEQPTAVQSFNARLRAIEEKLNILIKLWS